MHANAKTKDLKGAHEDEALRHALEKTNVMISQNKLCGVKKEVCIFFTITM